MSNESLKVGSDGKSMDERFSMVFDLDEMGCNIFNKDIDL